MKNSAPTEKQICNVFFAQYQQLKLFNYFPKKLKVFHIANEQNNNMLYTKSLLRMGMCPGAPDYLVIYQGGKAAFIEFKRDEKEAKKKNENQLKFKLECEELGVPYLLTWKPEEAIEWLRSLI